MSNNNSNISMIAVINFRLYNSSISLKKSMPIWIQNEDDIPLRQERNLKLNEDISTNLKHHRSFSCCHLSNEKRSISKAKEN